MVNYYAQLGGSRILNASRVDQSGADDADVTGWSQSDDFILAVCIHSVGKDTEAAQYKLRWRDVTDEGSFADVAATGEITYNATTNLVDGDAVTEAERKCSSQGDTWQNGEENEGDNLTDSIDLAGDCETEIHFALNFSSSAQELHQYEFELYDVTNGASKGTCGAAITLAAAECLGSGAKVMKPVLGRLPRRGHALSRGLVLFPLFNEGSGGQVFDLSGNNHIGTLSGTAPSWKSGKFGSCIYLPGNDEGISYGDIKLIEGLNEFTVSIWANSDVDDFTKHGGLITKEGPATDAFWLAAYSTEDLVFYVFTSGGTSVTNVVNGYENKSGEWHHIVGRYSLSEGARLFLDGVPVGTPTAHSGTVDATTNPMWVGNGNDSIQEWPGMLDLPMIYNRALTDSEIALLYREPFCMFEYDPIELWSAATGAAEALSANVSDSITVTESVTHQLPLLLVDVSDSITLNESITPLLPLLESTLFDSVGVTESITPLMPLLEVNVYDEITVTESVTPSLGLGVWLGINSSHYDSHCGDDGFRTVEEALDGTDGWRHTTNETHWVILDLGHIYNVQKVRGRSKADSGSDGDPSDVNIYVSNDKGNWGSAVATGIDTWQATNEWQEVDTTDKEGRYVKVEIVDTAGFERSMVFGGYTGTPFTIFDVCGVPTIFSASVSDSITVTESVTHQLPLLLVDVSDSITLNESITPLLPLLESTLFDSVGVTESITPLMPLLIADVSDIISVAENIDTLVPFLIAEVSDSITVTESIEAVLPLYEVLEYDSINVAEDVALENALLTTSLYDSISVSEYVTLEEALPIISASVYDSIAVAELVSAYIFTIWTRVMGDNDVTWQNRPDSNSMTWQNRTDSNSIEWRNV